MHAVLGLLFILSMGVMCFCVRNDKLPYVEHEKFQPFVTSSVRMITALAEGNNTKRWLNYIRLALYRNQEQHNHSVLEYHHMNLANIRMFFDSCSTVSVMAPSGHDWSPLSDYMSVPIDKLPCRGIEINDRSIDHRMGFIYEIRVLKIFSLNLTMLLTDLSFSGRYCYRAVLQVAELYDPDYRYLLLHTCGLMRHYGSSYLMFTYQIEIILRPYLQLDFVVQLQYQTFDIVAELVDIKKRASHNIRDNNKGLIRIYDRLATVYNINSQSGKRVERFLNYIIAYDILYKVVIESVHSSRCGDYLNIYDGFDNEVMLQNVTMCDSYVEGLVATSHAVYMNYFILDINLGILNSPTTIAFTRQELEAIYIPESNDIIQLPIVHLGLPVGLANEHPITHTRWVIPAINMRRKLIFHNVTVVADTAFYCYYGGIYIKHQIFQKDSGNADTIDYGPYCAGKIKFKNRSI